MEKRIAAYSFFFIAGAANASLAWLLLERPDQFIRIFTTPLWDDLALIMQAGVAAVIAAWALQLPFMRAARAGRRLPLYGWTLLGVLGAHAAYVGLVFSQSVVLGLASIEQGLGEALLTGVVSLVLGFVPNVLAGVAFAEFVLRQDKKLPAPFPAAGVAGRGA